MQAHPTIVLKSLSMCVLLLGLQTQGQCADTLKMLEQEQISKVHFVRVSVRRVRWRPAEARLHLNMFIWHRKSRPYTGRPRFRAQTVQVVPGYGAPALQHLHQALSHGVGQWAEHPDSLSSSMQRPAWLRCMTTPHGVAPRPRATPWTQVAS